MNLIHKQFDSVKKSMIKEIFEMKKKNGQKIINGQILKKIDGI